jgi:hypothetical protein
MYRRAVARGDHQRREAVSRFMQRANTPCSARVVGIQGHDFQLTPVFVPGAAVPPLWGRVDFFMAFGVSFAEPSQTFTLTR